MNKHTLHFLANKVIVSSHRLIFLTLMVISLGTGAETKTSHGFGNYTVHYSVFNSTMIQPDIANAHKLKRASNLAYINIAVVNHRDDSGRGKDSYGMAAQITGQARNLLQQQQLLRFIAIEEQNATYYLAPLYYNNEHIYHFDINVVVDTQTPTETFTFTKTLYVE